MSPELKSPQNEKGGTTFGMATKTGVSTPERTVRETSPVPEIATKKREVKPPPVKKGRGVRNALIAATALTALGGGGYAAYENIPAVHRAVDSAFLDHIKGKSSSPEASIAETVFDNSATEGVISEKNTIQMTAKEYAKIAPPPINRENVQKVPEELHLSGGTAIKKLTFERGTSINTLIYIKTADGQIRNVTYTKNGYPGEIRGVDHSDPGFPGCDVLVGKNNEIQAGDIFPSPISGYVSHSGSKQEYYRGEKLEEGATRSDTYHIEGKYIDEQGKEFKVRGTVYTLGYSGSAITKTLVPGIPNSDDFTEKDPTTGGIFTNRDKLNKARVKVNQGDDLFKFITVPPFQNFTLESKQKSQVWVTLSYQGDFGANGIADTYGGENCTIPTLDNKAIVLK